MKEDLHLYGNELNYFTTYFKYASNQSCEIGAADYSPTTASDTWLCYIFPVLWSLISARRSGYLGARYILIRLLSH